jgi:hypothetical protein
LKSCGEGGGLWVSAALQLDDSHAFPLLTAIRPEEVFRQHDQQLVRHIGLDFDREPLTFCPCHSGSDSFRVGKLPSGAGCPATARVPIRQPRLRSSIIESASSARDRGRGGDFPRHDRVELELIANRSVGRA